MTPTKLNSAVIIACSIFLIEVLMAVLTPGAYRLRLSLGRLCGVGITVDVCRKQSVDQLRAVYA